MGALYYSTGNKTHKKLEEWQRTRRRGRAPRDKHDWTLKDVLRLLNWITEKDGISKTDVLAAVAVALGFGTIFCKLAQSISNLLTVQAFFTKLAVTLGTGQLIALVIQTLVGAKIIAPPPLKIVLAIVISALVLIDNIISMIPTIAGDLETIREISGTVNELCQKTQAILLQR